MSVITHDVDTIEYRQLTVVDKNGGVAYFSGQNTLGVNNVTEGVHCIAAGNLLENPSVPGAMTASFASNAGNHLAERLLLALEAGVDAGGEKGPVKSAGLLVVSEFPWPLVDLRCDWDDDDPIAKLRMLWTQYQPQMDDYMTRALKPSAAPSYGVPGDC